MRDNLDDEKKEHLKNEDNNRKKEKRDNLSDNEQLRQGLYGPGKLGKSGKTIYCENKPGKPGKLLIFLNLYASFRTFVEF